MPVTPFGQQLADQINQIKEEQLTTNATNNVNSSLEGGEAFSRSIIGDGLSRISDNADVQLVRDRLRQSLEGDSKSANLRRSQAIGGLQGQQQAAQRSLVSSQSRSGVRGGAAAAAQLELQAAGLNARRSLEGDLSLQEANQEANNLNQFANFTSQVAQFDIKQEQTERAIQLQSQLGFTNLVSSERNSIRQQEAANLLAQEQSNANGGKK